MIANAINVLIGLWLTYSAIFAKPAGEMNNLQLTTAAIVIIACAIFARRTDEMRWQSSTNLVLGVVLGLFATMRAFYGEIILAGFWIILLAGIAVAIMAMWSILYRPTTSVVA